MNVKQKGDGAPSDHLDPRIDLKFLNTKCLPKKLRTKITEKTLKVNNRILRTAGGAEFKTKIVEYVNSIQDEDSQLLSSLSPSEALSNFESFVVKLVKEVVEREIHNRPNWFTQSEKMLLHHISLRNKAHKLYLSTGTNKINELKITQTNLQRIKRRLKKMAKLSCNRMSKQALHR